MADPEVSRRVKEINDYLEMLLGGAARELGDEAAAGENQEVKQKVLLEELQVTLEELYQSNEELLSAQQLILQERQRYLDLFNLAPIGILVTDMNGKILEANRSAARLFGRELDKLTGAFLINRVTWDERSTIRELLNKLRLQTDDPPTRLRLESQLVRGENEPFHAVLKVANLSWEQGQKQVLLWCISDVTGLKQAQAALEAANQQLEQRVDERTLQLSQANQRLLNYAVMLEQKNRDLQDFASIASHDLKEPLRKIKFFGDLLAETGKNRLAPEEVDYLQRMASAADRMEDMLVSLLEYSRLAAEENSYEPVDLDQLVEEALNLLEVRLLDSRGRVQKHPLPQIEGNPAQLQRLMQNIIANALKFHHPERAPQVEIWGEVEDNRARIYIRDNGIGFDEKFKERIFQPFNQLHGRGAFEGSGMGLAICRKITEHHGGQIDVQSRPGEGSTFTIELPVTQPG